MNPTKRRGNFPVQDKGRRRLSYYSGNIIPLPVVVTGPYELYGNGVAVHYVKPLSEAEMHVPLGTHETQPVVIAANGIYEPLR